MCKNRGSYDAVRVDIIQPIVDRPEDRQVRVRMAEYIVGAMSEPKPDVTRSRTRPRAETERDIAAFVRGEWLDEEFPELPAPPKPDWM